MIFYTRKGYVEASRANLRTKISVIKNNSHKYSVSTMCKVLKVSRSTYYYDSKPKKDEIQLVTDIVEIFRRSRNNSRIPPSFPQERYTPFKPHVAKCNEDKIENIVDRQFDEQRHSNFVVSDLTYVRVGKSLVLSLYSCRYI